MTDLDSFSVDPRIFRELGALLVKRDSIALTELLKNAYDADATEVRVLGERIDRPDGSIVIADNGVGMTREQFAKGFLRIATRSKETDDRASRRFGRRYTGEKGVGRLSAHRLGAVLDVQSIAMDDLKTGLGREKVRARIDWNRIEDAPSLAGLPADALQVRTTIQDELGQAGTTIRVRALREQWASGEIEDFLIEADMFEPPAVLLEPTDIVSDLLLFERPTMRRSRTGRDKFAVSLLGDFEVATEAWSQVADTAWWVIEIDSRVDGVSYAIAPTALALAETPDAEIVRAERDTTDPSRPVFQARIFAREKQTRSRHKDFIDRVAGIRVYMEGFRISPYGERGDDWLELDADYTRRDAHLDLNQTGLRGPQWVDGEGYRTLRNSSYTGAVLLTHNGAPTLQAPVNREGFVPSPAMTSLAKTVRTGIDLLTRTRAQLGLAASGQASGKRVIRRSIDDGFLADEVVVRDGLIEAVDTARRLRTLMSAASLDTGQADDFVERLEDLTISAERAAHDLSLLRLLAGAGTQMAAFVHEIQNVVSASRAIDAALGRLADEHVDAAVDLGRVRDNLELIRRQVERQALYLTDVATLESRKRRQRLSVAERLDRAWDLVAPAADRLGVLFENNIDRDVRTTPMYPSEATTVFTNLVTNAVKAAGRDGRILASAESDGGETTVRLQNTGKAVDVGRSERWFLPFESTSLDRLDPLLGQGMGLGLPITRSMLDAYGAKIRFTQPDPGMATCIEVRFR